MHLIHSVTVEKVLSVQVQASPDQTELQTETPKATFKIFADSYVILCTLYITLVCLNTVVQLHLVPNEDSVNSISSSPRLPYC